MSAPKAETSTTAGVETSAAVIASKAQKPLTTLTERRDFLAAARAKRAPAPAFLLQARHRGEGEKPCVDEMRIGYTCSKKVGNAVARNRAKRRLREIARAILPAYGRPGWDYVLIGRAEKTAIRDFGTLKSDLIQVLQTIHKSRKKP